MAICMPSFEKSPDHLCFQVVAFVTYAVCAWTLAETLGCIIGVFPTCESCAVIKLDETFL